jgi:hypothetical protein
MLLDLLSSLDVPRAGTWLPAALGLLTSSILICGSRIVFHQRHTRSAKAGTDPANSLLRDPFRACFAERRAAPRLPCEQIGVVVAGTETTQITQAQVLDRSLGGLSLLVTHRAVRGMLLALRRCDALPEAPWVQLRVEYCQPEQAGWKLGGQFIGSPALSAFLFG